MSHFSGIIIFGSTSVLSDISSLVLLEDQIGRRLIAVVGQACYTPIAGLTLPT